MRRKIAHGLERAAKEVSRLPVEQHCQWVAFFLECLEAEHTLLHPSLEFEDILKQSEAVIKDRLRHGRW